MKEHYERHPKHKGQRPYIGYAASEKTIPSRSQDPLPELSDESRRPYVSQSQQVDSSTPLDKNGLPPGNRIVADGDQYYIAIDIGVDHQHKATSIRRKIDAIRRNPRLK